MLYKIVLQNRKIAYELKINPRSKNLRLSIGSGGKVLITMPRFYPKILAKNFLIKQSDWILEKIKESQKNKKPALSNLDYFKKKAQARKIILNKINILNQAYNFKFLRIAIRNQKSRWGSCSAKGNLNFNYKICFLPENLQDYIIIHELCHLRELNHSPAFWKLVAQTVPNYLAARKELRKISKSNF